MRAAYVTTYDSADVRAWSGLGYYISRCLELAGIVVERVGPLPRRIHQLSRLRQLEAKLQRRGYPLDRDPDVTRAYAAEVERRLTSVSLDVVFSPGTIPIAYLQGRHPTAFWADATFGGMLDLYREYGRGRLSRRAIRVGSELDARALDRAAVALYASEWAAWSAIEYHGADPERVKVVPFGANMPVDHGRDEVGRLVSARPHDRCRLLFVGVDWIRKGGDLAVEVTRALNEQGLPTELHVVGSSPTETDHDAQPWLHRHGFVDKTTEDGSRLLRRLYSGAHFLIHPARAECFGVVFSEAAAHGVVPLATRVGGIPTAVRDGETGALFDVSASADDYADYIQRLLADRAGYERRALAAFDDYKRRLSWEAAAEAVGKHLGRLV